MYKEFILVQFSACISRAVGKVITRSLETSLHVVSEEDLGLVEEEDGSPETGREVGALAGRGGAQLEDILTRCLERLVDEENDVEEIEFPGKAFQCHAKLRDVERPDFEAIVMVVVRDIDCGALWLRAVRVEAEGFGLGSGRVGDEEIGLPRKSWNRIDFRAAVVGNSPNLSPTTCLDKEELWFSAKMTTDDRIQFVIHDLLQVERPFISAVNHVRVLH